ncbi:MAG TPA: winged helix DNA-binding domain-containing protein [Ktedonobacteraceae bacterium]|nr:winged helix DNA-binding domain-containing protein [Ktedonobacteraceae bacterium]
MRSLSWKDVWGRRLTRHALLAPRPKESMVEVVRAVCGIHAQMLPAAELSVGVRLDGGTRQDVRAELWQQRGLVKTYGLRGTVHLFPTDELPLWLAALRANPRPDEARRLAQMGLDLAQVEVIVAAIGEALDGQCLTREELGLEVARRVGSWATEAVSPAFGGQWPRWLMALGSAAFRGLLCFGPNRGQKVTFVRADQWLGSGSTEVDGTQALREVLRRYLSAYGPATHHEFAQWFGMPPGRALDLTRQLADELEEVDVEGYRAWLPRAEAMLACPPAESVVRLLPHFDCYLIGCHPRDRLVPGPWARRVLTRGSIGNVPVMVVDGIVAGLWQQKRKGKMLEIRVEAFQPLSPSQHQELVAAVARVGEFLEAESVLSLDTVHARPHL